MNITRCKLGHFYDSDEFDSCPYCKIGNNKEIKVPAPPTYPMQPAIPAVPKKDLRHPELRSYDGTDPYLFISYAHKDTQVFDILDQLQKNEYRFWYDEGIKTGAKWAREIAERISGCTQFLVFISRNSMLSENVKNEIALAIKKKKDIIRIHLDDVELDDELELEIGRLQSVFRNKYASDAAFYEKLMASVKPLAMTKQNDVTVAFEELSRRYEILNSRPSHGFSTVYTAKDRKTDATVFIKHISFNDSFTGTVRNELVYNELAVLKHLHRCPYTAHLLDYYEDNNNVYLVESFVEGTLLQNVVMQHALPVDDAVNITMDITEILCSFYRNSPRIVHSDIKPKNIVVQSAGHACLIDFGIARLQNGGAAMRQAMGTAGYAAPEQYHGVVDARTDIYGLGVTLFQMLTGLRDVRNASPFRLSSYRPDLPLRLEEIVLKMTAEEPENRYQSPIQLWYDLQGCKGMGQAIEKFTESSPFFVRPAVAGASGFGVPVAAEPTACGVPMASFEEDFVTEILSNTSELG